MYLCRYSGPTIHYVDEHYDTGRILAQRIVPVLADDTAEELAARVLHEVFETSCLNNYILIFFFTTISNCSILRNKKHERI